MTHTILFPRAEALVGGSSKTVLECTAMSGLRSPFATATARIAHTEGGFSETEDFRLALGYRSQSSMHSRFSGRLIQDSIRWAPKSVSFSGAGRLALTQEATGVVDEALSTSDPDLPPDYDTATYTLGWANATDGTIITDILAAYGETDVNIVDTGRHFATLAPSTASRFALKLASDQPGYDLIRQIDELTGCITFDGPDGRVTRIVASGRPTGSAARTFAEGVDFKGNDASREKSTEGLYNKIVIDGQGGQIDVDGVPVIIHAEVSGPSPYIPTPPGTRAYTLSSQLIDTQGFADDVAALLYEDKNWRRELVTLPLSYGDSSVYAGMTIAIDAPDALDLTSASRFRVIEVRDTFGAQGYQTTIVCEGAGDAAAQGTSPNAKPVVVIDYAIEFEGLANGDVIAVVSLDGSASYSPSSTIVTWEWDGDPEVPTPIGDGTRAVVVYNPLPDAPPPTVSLTLTDALGATATGEREIVADGGNAYTRELWVAEGGQLAYTEDQVAWEEYPVAAVVIPEEAGDTAILGATSGGTLHRVLLDGTDSTPGGPTGITAVSMSRDRNGKETGICWAASGTGAIWRSVDGGITWAAVAGLPNGGACHAIAESPYASGDVYAGGGNILYHSFDAGASWVAFYTHANASYVLTRFASGINAADASIMWLGFSGPDGATEPRVVERGGTLSHAFPGGTTAPRNITGLTISLDAARLFVTDDGDRAWTATTDGSEDLAPASAYDPGDLGTPRHAIRDGRFPVVWGTGSLVTWKSTDEGGSFLVVREEPGHMVAYGRLRPAVTPFVFVSHGDGDERVLLLWNGASNDAPPANWYTPGFAAGGWAPSLAVGPIDGTYGWYQVWSTISPPPDDAAGLVRATIALRPGAVKSATLTVNADDQPLDVYLNGTRLGGRSTGDASAPPLAFDVTALLIPGGANVIAISVQNHDAPAAPPGPTISATYRLEGR